MLVNCPNCQSLISVKASGENICKKCGAVVFIGDPLKDEEGKVLIINPYTEPEKDPDADDSDEDEDVTYSSRVGREQEKKDLYSSSRNVPEFKGVPWDRMKDLGFVEVLFQTTKEMLLTPTIFFIDMKYAKGRKFIPLYGVIFSMIAAVINMYWMALIINNINEFMPFISKLFPSISHLFSSEAIKVIEMPGREFVFFTILLQPVYTIMMPAFFLYFVTVMMGSRTEIHHYYRLFGFIVFLDILAFIPIVGHLVAMVWKFILIIKGIKVISMFSTGKAFATLIFYFIIIFMFNMMTLPIG